MDCGCAALLDVADWAHPGRHFSIKGKSYHKMELPVIGNRLGRAVQVIPGRAGAGAAGGL
jgi:hypothetical protein